MSGSLTRDRREPISRPYSIDVARAAAAKTKIDRLSYDLSARLPR
jgi:hypothetical protein